MLLIHIFHKHNVIISSHLKILLLVNCLRIVNALCDLVFSIFFRESKLVGGYMVLIKSSIIFHSYILGSVWKLLLPCSIEDIEKSSLLPKFNSKVEN
jgi:hypothetical protein